MTFEMLEKCLASPASLYEINYQELKQLVAEYPWCQTFRSVLVKKAFLEKAPDYEAMLHHNAGVCPDRSLLYKQIQELNELPTFPANNSSYFNEEGTLVVPDLGHAAVDNNFQYEDEVGIMFEQDQEQTEAGESADSNESEEEEDLWIPEINPVLNSNPGPARKVLALEDLGIHTAPSVTLVAPEATSIPVLEDEYTIPDLEESLMAAIDLMDFEEAHLPEEEPHELEHIAPGEALPPPNIRADMAPKLEESATGPQPAPAPKASFTSWLKQLPDARLSLEKISEHYEALPPVPTAVPEPQVAQPGQESPVKSRKKKSKVRRIAELSIQPREETASETMAMLLSNQGNYTQAIQMYERLQLIFPEKSDFFAARIEALKKELSHE